MASKFHKRLDEVLKAHPIAYWRERLNISNALISACWRKGKFPGSDKMIDLCKKEKISANWLLLGIGPKYINDIDDDKFTAEDREKLQSKISDLTIKIYRKEEELEKFKKDVETIKLMKWFVNHFKIKDENPAQQLPSITTETMSEKILMPVIESVVKTFMKLLHDKKTS